MPKTCLARSTALFAAALLTSAAMEAQGPRLCSDVVRTIEHPEQSVMETVYERVQKNDLKCFLVPWCCGPSWPTHPECYDDVSHLEKRIQSPASVETVAGENCEEISLDEAAQRIFRVVFDPTSPIRTITKFNPATASLSAWIGVANGARHRPLPQDIGNYLHTELPRAAARYRESDIELAGWLRFDEPAAQPLWALVPVDASGSKVASAITFDRTIVIGPDFLQATGSDRLALWAHEVTHVAQYQKDGIDTFLLNYINNGNPKPYCQIYYETEAYQLERDFRHALGNSNPTGCDKARPVPAQAFPLMAAQYSEKTSAGVASTPNLAVGCGLPPQQGFVCNGNPAALARIAYDLRANQVHLPPGTYRLEIEYSSPELVSGVALEANGLRQLLDFPATGGSGMGYRRYVRTQVTFAGSAADLVLERIGKLPAIRGLIFTRVW